MKKGILICSMILIALALTSCGALPTLPPLDSTVSVWTPQVTFGPPEETATIEVNVWTVTPAGETTQNPTATVEPEDTATPTPKPLTPTPGPTFTPTSTAEPINTATSTATPTSTAVPFVIQQMNPYYLKNFTHDDLGCDWLGVAGQIFNFDGQVQKDIVIKAGGNINNIPVVEDVTLPLAEPETDLAYGPGGFELTLATTLADTDSEIWIQLFSLGGDTLSEKVFLTTYNDCQKNLILLNFVEE